MPSINRHFTPINTRTVTALSLAGMFATAVFIGLPAMGTLRTQRTAFTDLRRELEEKHTGSQDFLEALRLYQRYKPYRAELARAVPPIGRKVEFITAIEQSAETSGVTLALKAGEYSPIDGTPFSTLPLELTAQGSFPQTVRFLAGLERLQPYLTVERVNVKATAPTEVISSTTPSVPPLVTTIQVTSYWQP